ncbi:MAG TPA: hypothetical protein VFM98_17810 [Ramlibacter sp.]|uniref:hypothetical protein n=1 Tax=Ramlibacter sp. TaxID=1917967 RepID=UPI002D80AF5A|nr:hypothetical protein [Ramlibacter sp.]HET8747461.1 hypothetical protein [Ramlibacter sp.]
MPISTREMPIRDARDHARLQAQLAAGAIIVDSGRRRPFYFDGRFLTAADLTADQDYIRARQSDLAQAMGTGVIRGLMVGLGTQAASGSPTLVIEPGTGITPSGDLVKVDTPLTIAVAALPQAAQLDAQLGIKALPPASAVNRSGLFVLALRPIEFSTNPTAAYPTTLEGRRTVRDGDIVEATALTLIPYPDRAGVENANAKRSRVAREIFFDRQRPGVLQDALPLAMLCLEGGTLRWLDVHMVRREVGAESTLAAGLSQRPRALLEAWLKQHQDQMDDIDTGTVQAGFAAARQFEVLPPVGPLPASTLRFETQLGALTLLQNYFPPMVDCEFAFVPADELAALVQESLALPPIDLRAADEDLDHLSILVVAPVTRQQLEAHKRSLQTVVRPVRAASAGLIAKRSPFESLVRIAQPAIPLLPTVPDLTPDALALAWQRAVEAARTQANAELQGRGMFWYLRKRQLPFTAEISGTTLRLAGDAKTLDAEVDARVRADAVLGRFNSLVAKIPTLARAETVNLLAAPRLALSPGVAANVLATSDLLRRSAFQALSARADARGDEGLRHDDVLEVARDFGDPELGEGFDALVQAAAPEVRKELQTPELVKAVAESGVAPALDRAARELPVVAQADFALQLRDAARGSDAGARLAILAGVQRE